jgi:hypothetical protein
MFGLKDARDRFADTLSYLQEHFGDLGTDIANLVPPNQLSAVSGDISLGGSVERGDAFKTKRRALRALLLCQRVYLSDLWPKYIGQAATLQPVNFLDAAWKETSRRYWWPRSEMDIQSGIRSYTVTRNTRAGLAGFATVIPSSITSSLTLVRPTPSDRNPSTCFDGVMLWLFWYGMVSYRWYLKYGGANTEASLTDAFGRGRRIYEPDNEAFDPTGARSRQLNADALLDHVLHLYCETQGTWPGHWLVSTGRGTACAVNNYEEKEYNQRYAPTRAAILKRFSSNCNLSAQFWAYKDEMKGGSYHKGVAVLIDPETMPRC